MIGYQRSLVRLKETSSNTAPMSECLAGKLKYTVRSACRSPPCRRGGFNDKQDLLWALLAGVFWMMSRVRMFEGCLGITLATRHPGTRDT